MSLLDLKHQSKNRLETAQGLH